MKAAQRAAFVELAKQQGLNHTSYMLVASLMEQSGAIDEAEDWRAMGALVPFLPHEKKP